MSSGHLLDASRATRLDASQVAKAPPNVAFDVAQKRVYPSLYPLPGSSHPPLFFPPSATLHTSPPLAPGMYSAGVACYAANYHSYITTCSPESFMPPMENPAPPVNNTDLRRTRFPFLDMPMGNATGTTTPLTSEDTGRHAQSAWPTFQAALLTQPEASLDLREVQHVQSRPQAAQEDLAVLGPPPEPGNVHIENYHANQESHAAPIAPGVCLCNDELNNLSHSPKTDGTIHTHLNNPDSACSRGEVICLDILADFVQKYPDALSLEKIAEHAVEVIAPLGSIGGQSAGLFSQVDTADPAPSQRRQIGREIALPGSSTTASPSISAHSSPSESFVHPPNRSSATSSSAGSTCRSAAKRKRSGDYPEDHADEQRREECTDAGDLDHDRNSCVGNNHILNCSENPRKKRRSSDNEEYICRICSILGKPCPPLSRRDSLKRHILALHEIFGILFGHEKFDLLKPRQKAQNEDLGPLIVMCVSLQIEAQRHGAEIKQGHDVAAVYPQIVASLNGL